MDILPDRPADTQIPPGQCPGIGVNLKVDKSGRITIRHHGRLHHAGIGTKHHGTPVTAIIDPTTITVIHQHTGQILATHTIDPTRNYWRNEEREPGRWPNSRTHSKNETHDTTHQ
jgi:hypothetical protein